jgi:hypothetical protein
MKPQILRVMSKRYGLPNVPPFPVLMLNGDWDRVTAVQENCGHGKKLRVMGGEHHHQATMHCYVQKRQATLMRCYTFGSVANQTENRS